MGYYVSAHVEMYGFKVTPSTEEIFDVYRNPLLIQKAKINGIKTSFLDLRTTYIISPIKSSLMLFSVSPFTLNSMTITNPKSNLPKIIKRMSMDKRYPVSMHSLKGEIKEIIQIFGKTDENNPKISKFTEKFYKVFNIPICKLVIQICDENILLSHAEPATKKEVDWNLVRNLCKEQKFYIL